MKGRLDNVKIRGGKDEEGADTRGDERKKREDVDEIEYVALLDFPAGKWNAGKGSSNTIESTARQRCRRRRRSSRERRRKEEAGGGRTKEAQLAGRASATIMWKG